MNSQDLSNLQEAYSQVYELDEAEVMKHQKERSAIERRKKMKGYEPPTKGVHGEIERRQAQKPPSKLRSGSLPESYDLYDIILSHLIEEGYAESVEQAEAIMVNMSEDWRESICEGDNYDKNRKRAAQRAAARNAARDAGQTGAVPGVGYVTPRRERETYRDAAGTERHKTGARMPEKKG